MSGIQCVVVTPEQTELDVQADSVTVPMFDGEMGILQGHSPLVGRLGYGVLKISGGSGIKEYFVEGGFIQVANNVVSILTDKLIGKEEVTSKAAEEAMQAASELASDQPELAATKQKAVSRARAMSRVANG
ncbi:MAG: ATP synthase F1 subunit epsilon [Pirellulaceae bacterium]